MKELNEAIVNIEKELVGETDYISDVSDAKDFLASLLDTLRQASVKLANARGLLE